MLTTFISLQSIPHKEARFILPITYPLMMCWAFCVTKLSTFLPKSIGPTILRMFVLVVVANDTMQTMKEQVSYKLGDKELFSLIGSDDELLAYENFTMPQIESVYVH